MQTSSTAELNLLWGELILEELTRLGVQHVCMAPGSRSTPLTLAAANQSKLQQHLHFDERGLGFMALGLAKASETPVAIITTSGTAVANLYPAIIEAWLTHVPLIVLSGDRPHELVGCGANQAIPQPSIYAQYAKAINLPTPDLHFPPQALLAEIDDAVQQLSGPLHINCMYREPLYPQQAAADRMQSFTEYLQPLSAWQQQSQPYVQHHRTMSQQLPSPEQLETFGQGNGVIVAGTLAASESPEWLVALAEHLGWPLLVDAQSQLRQHPKVIQYTDQLLLQPKSKQCLASADRVLVVGGRLLSKRLISFIGEQNWQHYWQVLPHQERLDPSHSSKQVWHCSLKQLAQSTWPKQDGSQIKHKLQTENQRLEQLLCQQIDQAEFGEAQVIRAISRAQQANYSLFIGNSLPIRLYDMYAPATQTLPQIFTNRGASGIDGLLATACGVAAAKQLPTTLIIGDISQLHDLNSLAIARQLRSPMVIVIFNNDGGNIFNLLPVPSESLRSDYYRLSHGLEFGYGAAMFNLPYDRVEQLADFQQAYTEALNYAGASVIEVSISSNQASEQIAQIANWVRQSSC